jgi:hypothetical protein
MIFLKGLSHLKGLGYLEEIKETIIFHCLALALKGYYCEQHFPIGACLKYFISSRVLCSVGSDVGWDAVFT